MNANEVVPLCIIVCIKTANSIRSQETIFLTLFIHVHIKNMDETYLRVVFPTNEKSIRELCQHKKRLSTDVTYPFMESRTLMLGRMFQ